MHAAVRLILTALVLVGCAVLIVTHGSRGIAVLVAVAVLATLPRTRVWRAGESFLVRLTGSRRRALALVMIVVLCLAIAINVYEFAH